MGCRGSSMRWVVLFLAAFWAAALILIFWRARLIF